MLYEEKVIDEVLHYRTGPTSPWRKRSDEDLTLEVLRLRNLLEQFSKTNTHSLLKPIWQ